MCDKEICDVFVRCKKCRYGALLYHNPDAGCIKLKEGAPAVPIVGPPHSNKFPGWVVVVCQHKECSKYNEIQPLSKDDFNSLRFRPHCPKCKQQTIPEREHQGKGNYAYRCTNDDCRYLSPLADHLPRWNG